ncbi:MAG: hypothetical protein COB12_13460 [Flavobacterium sp.]|nr:MAG: hypothetical protein COB12_13460 [Flavobacterium sp.]
MSLEQEIKKQYSKIFSADFKDWIPFKQMADYYLKTSAHLLTNDIDSPEPLKLWLRNVQKRLSIGIATELLLKAIYLKNGYNINKPINGIQLDFPINIQGLDTHKLNPSETYGLNMLIQHLSKIIELEQNSESIMEGLKISKVFRNKEGHVAVHWHNFERKDYDRIEFSLIELFRLGFNENLNFKISIAKNEVGKFEIE